IADSTGAAVPQAQVTAKNLGTGLTRDTQTDTQGFYVITELPLGDYEVTASKTGFRTATIRVVHVEVSARERVNVALQPGDVKEAIEVSGEVPLVETTIDNLGGTLEARQIAELPVNGRDFSKILTMVPGSTADPGAVSESPGSFGLFSINGNRGRSNNYLLDGTDMNDGYRNDPAINEGGVFGVPATILPLDAVAEFGILSETEAEYGRNSGAIVNIVTKSGTNSLHGSVFEYFRNDHLDARNYFNTVDQPQDLFLNNQFGGSVGGPIRKDQTFFFASYEGQRERVGIPNQITVPTQALINAQGVTINPVIAKLLARNPWGVPLPGGDPGNPAAATVQATNNAFNSLDSVIGKIDQHVGEKDLLTGRYFYGRSSQNFPLGLQQGAVGPGFNTIVPTHVQVLSLSYTHVISNDLLMEVRGGWNRFFETFTPQDASFNPASIGLDTVNSTDPLFGGLPQISISGAYPDGQGGTASISSLGNGGSQPRGRIDTNWQYFTNLSYTKGKHNFKTGIEFRRTSINGFQDTHFRGVLKFNNPVDPNLSLADFLTGSISGGGNESAGDTHRVTHQNNYGLYFQDNFRLTRRLTLNYGLRWDYFGVIHEEHNRFSIFDVATGQLEQVGSPGLSGLYPKDLNNFSPRAGIAYDLTGAGKTVLRAGAGIYYDAFSQDFFLGQAPYNCSFCPGAAYNAVGPSQILINGSPAATIQAGVPVFAPGGFTTDNEVFSVDQRLRTPYVYEYNLNVQQQLSGPMALQVGYVGSAGRKLFRYLDINQGGAVSSTFSYINQFQSSASSSYNSLQAVLTMKSWHGLTSTVNYTWSHSIDNASDGLDFVPQASQPDNSFRPDRERANSNFDVRNRLSWNYHYEVPTLGSWTPKLTKGWSLDGVLTLASGAPYDPTYYFEGDFNGGGEGFGRLDLVGNPSLGTSMPGNILNLQAFQVPCTWDVHLLGGPGCDLGTQHFGNVGRNAFTGPHYRNFDFSLAKSTPLSERVTMQVRADFFNIFNHPNFSNPELPCYCVDALNNSNPDIHGHPTGNLAITATPDVGSGNPFLGGGGPRDIQLAVRFSF
ncbi:MAG: TonB-dependent receptor, partial [Terriglobales bacterium]